jgi:glutathione S-transferase
MKLYYMTAACSLAPHIALREAGIDFTLVRFDMKKQALADGGSLMDVNEKGYVPVLELDDGQRLTEVTAVLQYIADLKPESKLAPANGTMPRYRLQEWLNFIATEVHKIYWPLFHDGAEIEKTNANAKLKKSFDWLEKQLGTRPYLMGEQFTVADAYLVTVINWMKPAGIDGNQWPGLKDYRTRVRARPAVIKALEAEGLLRPAA